MPFTFSSEKGGIQPSGASETGPVVTLLCGLEGPAWAWDSSRAFFWLGSKSVGTSSLDTALSSASPLGADVAAGNMAYGDVTTVNLLASFLQGLAQVRAKGWDKGTIYLQLAASVSQHAAMSTCQSEFDAC